VAEWLLGSRQVGENGHAAPATDVKGGPRRKVERESSCGDAAKLERGKTAEVCGGRGGDV